MDEHLNADQRAAVGQEPDPITASWTRQLDAKDKRIAELERRLALAEGADTCEACGRLIAVGEERHDWADGVTTCMKCGGPEDDARREWEVSDA